MPTNKKKKKKTKATSNDLNQAKLEGMANDPSTITARRLSKVLPDGLREGLREGPSGEAAQNAFALLYAAKKTDGDGGLAWDEFYMNMVNLAVPGQDFFSTYLKQKVLGQLFTLRTRIPRNCEVAYGEEWVGLVNCFKCDLNVVIQNNRKAITMACFKSSEAAFLDHCKKINDIPPTTFRALLGEKFITDSACILQIARHVQTASLRMVFRLDQESSKICWECAAKKCRFTCSGCSVAVYCSPTCQLNHWNSVHRSVCKRVMSTYKAIQKAEAVICQALSNAEEHSEKYGARPSFLDFDTTLKAFEDKFVVDLCHKQKNLLNSMRDIHGNYSFIKEIGKQLDGPNIIYFYKNVKHVALGDFQIDSGFKEEIPKASDGPCERVFLIICQAMMYNYEGEDGALRVDLFRTELAKRSEGLSEDGDFSQYALSDWLATYKSFSAAKSCQAEVLSCLREQMLNRLTKWFREDDRVKDIVDGGKIVKKLIALTSTTS